MRITRQTQETKKKGKAKTICKAEPPTTKGATATAKPKAQEPTSIMQRKESMRVFLIVLIMSIK